MRRILGHMGYLFFNSVALASVQLAHAMEQLEYRLLKVSSDIQASKNRKGPLGNVFLQKISKGPVRSPVRTRAPRGMLAIIRQEKRATQSPKTRKRNGSRKG